MMRVCSEFSPLVSEFSHVLAFSCFGFSGTLVLHFGCNLLCLIYWRVGIIPVFVLFCGSALVFGFGDVGVTLGFLGFLVCLL